MKIMGAPKITRELRKQGEVISERTVGKYMRETALKPNISSIEQKRRETVIIQRLWPIY